MSIDGNWNIETNTPLGVQKATLSLKSDGGKITGTTAGAQGSLSIEGTVSGNTAKWPAKVTSPMPMDLEFTVTADGDNMTGEVKSPFGNFPLKGTRA
ncbi:MAG: hypothetical protein JNJ73_14250 [Hyphomonadaceae bacterium]|nr:hypothetical protein [Hyphomonadaceae bacterium]